MGHLCTSARGRGYGTSIQVGAKRRGSHELVDLLRTYFMDDYFGQLGEIRLFSKTRM